MYASRDDLFERFGQVSIENLERMVSADKQPSAAITEAAIADASEEADSYIAVSYSLPLPAVPAALKRVVCDIARYRLHSQQSTEEITQRYEDAIAWLKRIADKKAVLKLPIDESGQQPDATQNSNKVAVGTSDYNGVFGRATTDKMPSV